MKYHIRSGVLPWDKVTPQDCLTRNVLGSNSGNLIYQYSIVKLMSLNNVEFSSNRYSYDLDTAKKVNEECEAFIIPLADAFREDFMVELKSITNFIKALNIPCVVVGVGLRAPYEPNLKNGFRFDKTVKEFVNAVLETGTILGLRGEITARYLKNLGYREEIDFTVIGCPSLYMNGDRIPLKNIKFHEDMRLGTSFATNEEISGRFLNKVTERFKNHFYVGQVVDDLRTLYTGLSMESHGMYYPCDINSRYYKDNRCKFFINVPKWLQFMQTLDLAVGTRFHGTVAGLLAGTPSVLIKRDTRTRELSEYHGIPSVLLNDIKDMPTLENIITKVDFSVLGKKHGANFNHFVDFMTKNNIKVETDAKQLEKFIDRIPMVGLHNAVTAVGSVSLNHVKQNYIKLSFDSVQKDKYVLSKWLDISLQGRSLSDYLSKKHLNRIVVFGVGNFAAKLLYDLRRNNNITLVGLIDHRNIHINFCGIDTKTINEIDFSKVDLIVSTKPNTLEADKKKFINSDKIISISDLVDNCNATFL